MAKSWLRPALAGTVFLVAVACTEMPDEGVEDSLVRDPPAAVTAKLAWGRCADAELRDIKAQCATLTVPMDYANPGGAQVKLALSRLRHKVPAARFEGVMLTNPGGPGQPGLAVPTLVDGLPQRVSDRYDWIGFDPRGIGASRPAVHCDPDNDLLYRRSYVTTTAAEVAGWRDHVRRYAAACGKRSGRLLEHMTTLDTALDMESIRRSLGATRVSYYGFSYGTYLGAVYATRFPGRLNRLVLDSNVDPREVWYRSIFSQDVAFEQNATAWFGWLAKYHRRYGLGTTEAAVEKKFYATQNALPANPRPGQIGRNEWVEAFLTGLYSPENWDTSAEMWIGWLRNRDPRPIINTIALEPENTSAANLAVTCTDAPWPELGALVRDTRATYAKARMVTWANTWQSAPCVYWPAAAEQPVTVDGSGVRSALLIDQTHDGPTPYAGSLELRRRLPRASLVAVPGGSAHAESLTGNNPCVGKYVAAYLASGSLPKRVAGNTADATCKAIVPAPG
jgi:pimeloyl-ACP methyl ester carboxylesterase